MNQHNINALPVLEDDELVGIITSRDVMGVLLEAVGIEKDSSRLTVLVKDRIGVIADISRILRAEEINIRSLFTWPEKTHPGVYYLVVRVPAGDGDKAAVCLAKDGFKVLTAYTQDLDPYQPAS
jgi:acetoin utilization protein AcuB